MEIVALILGGALLVGLAGFANRDTPARREKRLWAAAAKNLGLSGEVGALTGTLDGAEVTLSLAEAGSPRPSIEVVATPQDPARVSLRTWQEGKNRDGSVRTGDKAFDRVFLLRGEVDRLRAAMTGEVRNTLMAYGSARDLQVTRGVVTMRVLGAAEDLSRMQEVARQGAALATALSVPRDQLVARLRDNAASDLSSKTRRLCLELLLEEYPDDDTTQAAITTALSDDSPNVRTAAALRAGAAGTQALEEVMDDPDASYELRDEAAFQLARTAALGRVKELLGPYLIDGHPLRARAVEQMIARGADPGLGPLMTMLRSDDPEEICVGARCVGAHGYKQAEVTLVQLVSHEDKKVQVGVVHALGQVGTKRALGVLHKTTEDHLAGTRLKRAAKEAVRRIEARASVPS